MLALEDEVRTINSSGVPVINVTMRADRGVGRGMQMRSVSRVRQRASSRYFAMRCRGQVRDIRLGVMVEWVSTVALGCAANVKVWMTIIRAPQCRHTKVGVAQPLATCASLGASA